MSRHDLCRKYGIALFRDTTRIQRILHAREHNPLITHGPPHSLLAYLPGEHSINVPLASSPISLGRPLDSEANR